MAAPQPNLLDPIADTLTLVLPGTGHMLRGRWAAGFALAGWVGMLSTCIWAIHGSLTRLDATLPFLGYPREAGVWVLGALMAGLALIHVCALARHSGGATVAPHPVVSGVASGLIPGWGQLLNGHRLKAATFVAGLWVVAASWRWPRRRSPDCSSGLTCTCPPHSKPSGHRWSAGPCRR